MRDGPASSIARTVGLRSSSTCTTCSTPPTFATSPPGSISIGSTPGTSTTTKSSSPGFHRSGSTGNSDRIELRHTIALWSVVWPPFDRRPNRGGEGFDAERLLNEERQVVFDVERRFGAQFIAGHQQDTDRRVPSPQSLDELSAVHPWHDDVRDHEMDRRGVRGRDVA